MKRLLAATLLALLGAYVAMSTSSLTAAALDGYKVVFVPFSGPKPAGKYETFAGGFAGKTPLAQPDDAAFRPTGLAQGPDGSLYVSDTQKGRIWRVVYRGNPNSRGVPRRNGHERGP